MSSSTPSKNAVFDNKKGIRGGIPVVFRKFTSWLFTWHYATHVWNLIWDCGMCWCIPQYLTLRVEVQRYLLVIELFFRLIFFTDYTESAMIIATCIWFMSICSIHSSVWSMGSWTSAWICSHLQVAVHIQTNQGVETYFKLPIITVHFWCATFQTQAFSFFFCICMYRMLTVMWRLLLLSQTVRLPGPFGITSKCYCIDLQSYCSWISPSIHSTGLVKATQILWITALWIINHFLFRFKLDLEVVLKSDGLVTSLTATNRNGNTISVVAFEDEV